jgi:hypothetical protein
VLFWPVGADWGGRISRYGVGLARRGKSAWTGSARAGVAWFVGADRAGTNWGERSAGAA